MRAAVAPTLRRAEAWAPLASVRAIQHADWAQAALQLASLLRGGGGGECNRGVRKHCCRVLNGCTVGLEVEGMWRPSSNCINACRQRARPQPQSRATAPLPCSRRCAGTRAQQ